ncbi:hypothetical protein ACNQGP_09310 [Flavobacterium sp. GT2N3]|uniref:hypothetical protein n=1 Tax=unclassified Flavobacterium TaxID=196869 RepID=UPI003AAE88B9
MEKCLNLEYDVVLSFAGEDRKYVEKTAEYLRKSGVKVFYDVYEDVNLWVKIYINIWTIFIKTKLNMQSYLFRNIMLENFGQIMS